MKAGIVVVVLGGLGLCVATAKAQPVALRFEGALVTDRHVGVRAELPAARGPGAVGVLNVQFGRFEGEALGLGARLRQPEQAPGDANWQTVGQLEVRLRYRLFGPVAVEGGVVGRMLDPDPDGERVGFVTAGAFVRWPVTRGAWIWGRLGVIPWATFEGGGGFGFAAETGVGVELELSPRIRVTTAYGFQRVDRKLTEPGGAAFDSPLEYDVLRVGIRWAPGRAAGDVR